jgi:signal transduction histidine kinase
VSIIVEDEPPAPLLIVDDEPHNLTALVALLEDTPGVRLVTANSGDDALRHILEEDFALILLDVQMPGMDGFETAELIRMREKSRETPILFQTAWHSDQAKIARGYAVGAVDYVVKPIDPVVLKSKIAVFLDLHRKTRALERKNLELAAALDQAERANEFKTRFLASVSHELRTPLGGILGFAELLDQGLAGDLSELQQAHVKQILSSAEHLILLVNDLLDLSKIEAGRMELSPRWTPLRSLTDSVLGALLPVAAKAGVDVTADVPADFPRLYVDPLRMRQVLFNLVSNAIKFSPQGSTATLRAYMEPGTAAIAVEDHGIGIPGEQVHRLFQEFQQVRDSAGNGPAGTGLGLALARHFVELHGGTIGVDTVPGRGSVFTVRLPTRRTTPNRAPTL